MNSKDRVSTKDSIKTNVSAQRQIQNCKDSFYEIKHLYEINKEVFKINLSSISEESFKKVLTTLNEENTALYNLLIRYFLKHDTKNDFEKPTIYINHPNSSDTKESKDTIKKILSRVESLEKELSIALKKKKEPETQQMLLFSNFAFTKDNLKYMKEKKALEQKLIFSEYKLSRLTKLKNDLLRQNFVNLLGN